MGKLFNNKRTSRKLKLPKEDEKIILISSVADLYNPYELKYNKTREILKELQNSKHNIEILTKSKYIEKDIDIIKNIENIHVGISLSTLDDNYRKLIEPNTSRVNTFNVNSAFCYNKYISQIIYYLKLQW